MGIGANKAALRAYCEAYHNPTEDCFASAVERLYAKNAQINMVHPFNEVAGADGYRTQFLGPLLSAFTHLRRSD